MVMALFYLMASRLRMTPAGLERQAGIVPDAMQASLSSLPLGNTIPCSLAKMADGMRRGAGRPWLLCT
jgi:hypothetical protein